MAIKDLVPIQTHLFLCNGGTCKLKGAEESTAAIRQAIADNNLAEQIHTTKTLCNGRCKDGPVVIAQPGGVWFKQMTSDCAAEFTRAYLMAGQIPEAHFLLNMVTRRYML
jgi:(2Fe-2S) ferredoxin